MLSVASRCTCYLLESVVHCLTGEEASSPRSPQASGSDSEVHRHVSQVNDSLYLLHKPEGKPNVQIVFFHGLQLGRDYSSAHVSTWKNQDGSCVWPRTWLVEDFPRAHVLSVCYPGLEQRSNGSVDMFIIGENLVWDLLQEKIGSSCPVVLVGHSFGGLVIKQLCCYAHDMLNRTPEPNKAKLNAFLNSIKGIFFYSTPHHGSTIARTLKKHFESPLLIYFELLSTAAARLNSTFDQISKENYKWLFAGLCETLPTNLGPFVDVVVREASARDHEELNLMGGADHFSICRPRSKIFRNFSKLAEFISRIASDSSKVAQLVLPFSPDSKYVVLKSTMMEVRKALESETTGPVVTLSGGPGQGKTSMARYLALYYQNASDLQDKALATASKTFVDGVVFLSCGQNADSKGLLFELWESLGYELLPLIGVTRGDVGSSNILQQASITESSLSKELRRRLSTENVLIILDDVWEAIVIERLLFPGKSLKYLITTQVQRLWTGTGCEDICLKPPTSEEACQILTNHVYGRHLGGHSDITPPLQDAIDAVVEKADRHPLVLANVATNILWNIQAEDVDPLEQWRSAVKYFEDLVQNEDGHSSVVLFNHTYPRNMKASMTMALSSLPQHEQTLLLVASIFKTQPIPEVVFKLFFKRLHGTLAKFSRCSKHLQSNSFIHIESAKLRWSTVPERTWSLHALRQLFIGIIKESELTKLGDKLLECNTQADVVVELLLLYGNDPWRGEAAKTRAKTLGIPMLQFQDDSFELAPIKSFVWLLHSDADEDWKKESDQLAQQILQKYIYCHELDDNSVSTLLSTTEIHLYAVEALENFSILNPPRVVIPKTIRALVNLLETNLGNGKVTKISVQVAWLLTEDFGNLPDNKLKFTSISRIFEKLVALFGPDENSVTRQFAVSSFLILAGVVQSIPVIGLFPNLIERLAACLDKDGSQGEQEVAVSLLAVLGSSTLENSIIIGRFPNLIERLVEFWAEDIDRSEELCVHFLLLGLMQHTENLIKIGQCPNFLERLVGLLADDGLQVTQFRAAMLLAKLVQHDEYRREIGQIPSVHDRLLALLAKDEDLHLWAPLTLSFLFLDSAEYQIKVSQVSNVIERLVALLAEDASQNVQKLAAQH